MTVLSRGRIACSFCGTPERDMEQMFAGPTVYICADCVMTCAELVAERRAIMDRRAPGEREYDSWGSA